MSVGKLAVRLVVGGLFVGHGLQKLKGWFGGPGIEGTEKMMDATGMQPARAQAIAAGATEAAAGAMLAAGFLTPLASAGIVGVMTTAIRKVHAEKGVWNAQGGWEYNAVLIASAFALAEAPGRLSLDAAMGRKKWGAGWALGAIAAGAAGSAAAMRLGAAMRDRGVVPVKAVEENTGVGDAEQGLGGDLGRSGAQPSAEEV